MVQDNQPGRIIYDEEPAPPSGPRQETPKIVLWVVKYSGGYINSEKQAEYVLLAFVAVVFLFLLWRFLLGTGGAAQLGKTQIEQIIKNQQGAYAPR